jgi:hypothetical protein
MGINLGQMPAAAALRLLHLWLRLEIPAADRGTVQIVFSFNVGLKFYYVFYSLIAISFHSMQGLWKNKPPFFLSKNKRKKCKILKFSISFLQIVFLFLKFSAFEIEKKTFFCRIIINEKMVVKLRMETITFYVFSFEIFHKFSILV